MCSQGNFQFKLYLEPAVLREEKAIDPRLPPLPVSTSIYLLINVTAEISPFLGDIL